MSLPLPRSLKPQLARSRAALPDGDGWAYEPKWDGFRAIAFVDGDEVALQSRGGKPLRRYFPELEFPPGRYVLDGEIVQLGADGKQDFDALGQRIHPAKSRIERLARETPTRYIAFDLLARDDEVLLDEPYERRRALLEELVEKPVDLTPSTRSREEAEPWLFGAEGVVAKQIDQPYCPGERRGAAVDPRRTRRTTSAARGEMPWTNGSRRVIGGYQSARRSRSTASIMASARPSGDAASGPPRYQSGMPRCSCVCSWLFVSPG